MAKKIISLGLLCILGLGMTGCISFDDTSEPDKTGFVKIKDKEILKGIEIFEYVDQETGVHYYIGTSGYKGIMSPVYNSDGSVKVDK